MKNKKVSIIIPYYRSSVYLLRKCLTSCLEQSYDNIEIILLLDGADPSIVDIVAGIDGGDRIKIIRSKKNLGVSTQRNVGIEKSHGDFIAFVDSDDYLERDMVQKTVEAFNRDIDIVMFGVLGEPYDCEEGIYDSRVFFSFPKRFCRIQYTNFVWNKMFRADIIRDNNIRFRENIRLGEDAIFCQEYLSKCRIIRCIVNRLYHYTRSDSSVTKQFSPEYGDYELEVIKAVKNNYMHNALCNDENEFFSYWMADKIESTFRYYYEAYANGQISKEELLQFYAIMIPNFKPLFMKPGRIRMSQIRKKISSVEKMLKSEKATLRVFNIMRLTNSLSSKEAILDQVS